MINDQKRTEPREMKYAPANSALIALREVHRGLVANAIVRAENERLRATVMLQIPDGEKMSKP